MKNRWQGLDNENFRFENLGRPAVFLIPVNKLGIKIGEVTVEKIIHKFIVKNFKACTWFTIPSAGIWTNANGEYVYDECRLYRVSFVGKEKITLLGEKLAKIAIAIGEDCISFDAGQYSSIIHPIRSS